LPITSAGDPQNNNTENKKTNKKGGKNAGKRKVAKPKVGSEKGHENEACMEMVEVEKPAEQPVQPQPEAQIPPSYETLHKPVPTTQTSSDMPNELDASQNPPSSPPPTLLQPGLSNLTADHELTTKPEDHQYPVLSKKMKKKLAKELQTVYQLSVDLSQQISADLEQRIVRALKSEGKLGEESSVFMAIYTNKCVELINNIKDKLVDIEPLIDGVKSAGGIVTN